MTADTVKVKVVFLRDGVVRPGDYRMPIRPFSTTICRMIGRPFSTTRGACSTARRLLCFSGSNVDYELLSCTSSTVRSRLCSTTGRPGLTQKEITLPEEGQLKEPANIANSEMPSLMLVSVGHTAVSNYDSRARWLQQTAQWLIYGFLGFAK